MICGQLRALRNDPGDQRGNPLVMTRDSEPQPNIHWNQNGDNPSTFTKLRNDDYRKYGYCGNRSNGHSLSSANRAPMVRTAEEFVCCFGSGVDSSVDEEW